MELDKVAQPNSTPPAKKKPRSRKALAAVGGLCVLLLVTVGVVFGTRKEQETYNGSRDILRMLETAPGIKITLHTTGIYADNGEFQQTDILIVPKDFSKYTTELVFDAKVQFQSGNTSFTHIVKDSKAYTIEEVNDTTTAYCANVPEMPHLDAIIDTILYAQAVDEDSEFRKALDCPKASHRLIHTVWEDLDYFYCFDTTGAQLGSFLGPAMIGKVEYLSESIPIEAPQDVECAAIDLNEISKSTEDIFDIEQSRRRLKAMTQESCEELVRLGQCEFCYSETFGTNSFGAVDTWGMIVSSFSMLNVDFTSYSDLSLPPDMQIDVRRSLRRSIIGRIRQKISSRAKTFIKRVTAFIAKLIRYEHPGIICIFIHGAGVSSISPEVRSKMDWYWGEHTRVSPPPYCSSVKYIQVNTKTRKYNDESLQRDVSALVKKLGKWDGEMISEAVLITHGTAGLTVAEAITNGKLKLSETVVWLALNVPQHGSDLTDYHKKHCHTNDSLKYMLLEMSAKELTCNQLDNAGYSILPLTGNALKNYENIVSMGICGASASHKRSNQKSFIAATETSETEGQALKTLSDGMTRLEDCLQIKNGVPDPKFTILATNYWDSQMKVGSKVLKRGSVAFWLHVHAQRAVEPLVNGKNPKLASNPKLLRVVTK